jgi:hypothetical protein
MGESCPCGTTPDPGVCKAQDSTHCMCAHDAWDAQGERWCPAQSGSDMSTKEAP